MHLRNDARAFLAPLALLPVAAAWLAACGPPRHGRGPAPSRLETQVTRVLNTDAPDARFYRDRSQLESLGPELDAVLVSLLDDSRAKDAVRANAAILLADRRAPAAVPVLRRVVLNAGSAVVRSAAVVGLERLAPESAAAAVAVRGAILDRAPEVRLNVLQGLDVEDAPLVRALLKQEEDPQVKVVARQLLALLEARGAPLVADRTGDFRTAGSDSTPKIVFHPVRRDTLAHVDVGALWVEVQGKRLVPLAQEVEAVGGVIPAFFDTHGDAVVYEAEHQVRIRNLRTGATRVLGPGTAPRPVPFSDRFVFLQERTAERRGAVQTYDVVRASFAEAPLERLGQLQARTDAGAASPVRSLVVGEARDGFVLRGVGVSTFLLPDPFEGVPQAPVRR
ncbi:MAG TPA: hypothetical protein VFE05_08710 [Longimicrobiaceae bacterium]|jgi:hypothetical protein|nr:hypothetical protein [Longimicrobiaceae bacterium]